MKEYLNNMITSSFVFELNFRHVKTLNYEARISKIRPRHLHGKIDNNFEKN